MGLLTERNRVSRLRDKDLLLLAMLVPLSVAAFAQEHSDPWLIVANGETGSITARTTRKDLVRLYGPSNVVDQDIDIGEGEMEPATFLFRQDPERRLEILWKDPDRKANPRSAEIRGQKSRWHGVYGVSLGTTSVELEHINGRPFRFALVHDGTDMADEPISWHDGSLEKDFQGVGRVVLWLESSPAKHIKQDGPRDFSGESNTLRIREMNLHITSMTWIFPSPEQP